MWRCLVIWVGVLCLQAVETPVNGVAGGSSSSSRKHPSSSMNKALDSTVILPMRGNVYPDGLFYVTVWMGIPPKPYFLDVDTGSDFTWLQCDAPCIRCPKGPHPPYRPRRTNLVPCNDTICTALGSMRKYPCERPGQQQCDYLIEYVDLTSSLGVLVRDVFFLRSANASTLRPSLKFGCGYDQRNPQSSLESATDGILGLGNGRSSIVSQLSEQELIKNVIGHCISGQGGEGYLFFGADLVPSVGVTWISMHPNPSRKYSPGPAHLLLGKQRIKDLMIVFDSGTSYTYFTSRVFHALVSALNKDLAGRPIKQTFEDNTLPLCWRAPKAFNSTSDAKYFFKTLILDFKNGKKVRLEIPPENYLIISSQGNACLGILNGTEVGLRDFNLIGDIFMQSHMMIYDNESHRIGWIPANCNHLSRVGSLNNGVAMADAAVGMHTLTTGVARSYWSYPPGTVQSS